MPRMTIWRMRVASQIPKATNTRSHYAILTALLLFQYNNGYTNVPHCYVTRTLPVRFTIKLTAPFIQWSHNPLPQIQSHYRYHTDTSNNTLCLVEVQAHREVVVQLHSFSISALRKGGVVNFRSRLPPPQERVPTHK
jgi:hypothetical protein